MKILVTGASGLLGRAVVEKVRADGHDVVGTAFTRANAEKGLRKVDLTDESALKDFLDEVRPDAIFHSAAERRPDVVEKQPEASQVLNVEVPRRIATWAKQQASSTAAPLVIYISTDYVFDGVSPPFSVEDAPNPLNAYGRSKWDGEKAVREAGVEGRVTCLRVPVLYGKTESDDESAVNVLLGAVTASKDGSALKAKKMDANAVRYPTNVADVAKALSQLCKKYGSTESIPPILHFSATEAMTKYDMCLVMARCLRAQGEQAETEHLVPEYEIDPSAATSRPRHCKLDLSLIKSLDIDITCGNFESWWTEYLKEYAERARERRRVEAEEAAAREAERQAEEEKARQEAERKRQEEERRQQEEERRRQEEEEKRKQAEEEQRRLQQEAEDKQKAEAERREEEAKAAANKTNMNDSEAANAEDETIVTQAAVPSAAESITTPSQQREASSDEPTTALPQMHTSRSSTRPASLGSPSSPHPSFSSLQARPTPPATSGRSSPSPSIASTGGHALPNTHAAASSNAAGLDANGLATSMSTATGDDDRNKDSVDPLEYAAAQARKQAELAQQERAALERGDTAGFFPEALTRKGDGASLGIAPAPAPSSQARRNLTVSTDADSDNYGQPSPRDEGGAPATSRPFAAGYGEVPYGLQEQAAVAAATGTAASGSEGTPAGTGLATSSVPQPPAKPQRPNFQIRVGDPQKIGDPISAHIVYTVRIKTDSPHFKASQFSVLRRYSDFRWLHAALVHCNPGIFVPPVPEKVKIGRFAPDLVESRRHGLESCINKIANNPALQDDDDLRMFLESENFQVDVKMREQIRGPVPTPEQKTYFGWSTSLTGQTHRFHETDSWFDEQNVYLDHLEMQLRNLVRILSALAQQRKDVAMSTSDFSHALMMLSGSSLSRSLSTCFAGLGEVERRSFELADLQSDADVRDFGSVVYEFERMVGSARKAFSTRIDAWQTWQRLEDELRKVRTRADKLKREAQQGSHRASDGRLQAALDEQAGLNARCLQAKTDFDLISRLCKEEMDKFEGDRIEGFHMAIEAWLQGMIERQTEMMAEWEQYAALLQRQTGQYVSDLPRPVQPDETPAALPDPHAQQPATEASTESQPCEEAPVDAQTPIATSDVKTDAPTPTDKNETSDKEDMNKIDPQDSRDTPQNTMAEAQAAQASTDDS